MYPSKILDEKSLDGIPLDTVADIIDMSINYLPRYMNNDNSIITHNTGESIMKSILDMSSKFLQIESLYNINNSYNFGFLPYYFAQKLVPICRDNKLSDTIDTLVTEYIINTTNYRYTLADIHKVKLLLLHIIVIISGKNLLYNADVQLRALDTAIKYDTIIQTVYDTFSYIRNDKYTAETLITKVIEQSTKALNSDQTMLSMLTALPDEVKVYVVNMWCYINKVTVDNIDSYRQTLGSYYDFTRYVVIFEEPINELLDMRNKMVDHEFNFIFSAIEEDINNCDFHIPINSAERLTLLLNKTPEEITGLSYKVYIYTSFLIYDSMILPSINDYDSKNGGDAEHLRASCKDATSEFLISKVYEDISNYCMYSYYNHNTIEYNQDIYKEYTKVKSLADKDIFAYTDKLVVINTPKFLTMLINTLCPSTFHPSKYKIESNKHSYCHFIKDKGWLNLYNIFNIDASYILVKSTNRYSKNNIITLVNWAQNIQVIFRPLKNLYNYYYRLDNPDTYMKYMITYTTELIAREDIKENNRETGGDLYSIFNNSFYLIDSKKYDVLKKTDKDIRSIYLKTLVQCWLYMNMYYYPICTLSDENRTMDLYKNIYVAAMNPLYSHMVIATYSNINKIITDDIRAKYKFA